jgi:phospholipid-transporting ATPase
MLKNSLAVADIPSINEFFEEVEKSLKDCKKTNKKQAILIEGEALKIILDENNPKLSKRFLKISLQCDSVVVCRCSPKQKAKVVRLVKSSTNKITLSIGDGANDVNMI